MFISYKRKLNVNTFKEGISNEIRYKINHRTKVILISFDIPDSRSRGKFFPIPEVKHKQKPERSGNNFNKL